MKKLIYNATFIDDSFEITSGSLLLHNNKIERIFAEKKPKEIHGIRETVDASEMIITAGMTNAHYHSYSNVLKGTVNNLPLEIWSLYTVAYGHSLEEEDIYLSVLLGAAEMIKNGITACVDHFPHIGKVEGALKAYKKSKMRVGFAPMMHDVHDHQFLSVLLPSDLKNSLEAAPMKSPDEMETFYREIIKRYHRRDDRTEILLGPNAPQRCTPEMLDRCRLLSEEFNIGIQTHLLETKGQLISSVETFPEGVIGYLNEHGLLSPKLSVAHSVMVDDREIELLGNHGVTIVHNPVSNMMLGSGRAPINKFLNQKINVALGTDASNCGIQHNLFETMRITAMFHRLDEPNYNKWPQSNDVLKMATTGGAKIVSTSNQTGVIAEGAKADLVFIKKDALPLMPLQDAINQLVFHGSGNSVDSVMIGGQWVMREQQILTFNEKEVVQRINERADKLIRNSENAVALADRLAPFFKKRVNEFQRKPIWEGIL